MPFGVELGERETGVVLGEGERLELNGEREIGVELGERLELIVDLRER